jgi:hypothetical protein
MPMLEALSVSITTRTTSVSAGNFAVYDPKIAIVEPVSDALSVFN